MFQIILKFKVNPLLSFKGVYLSEREIPSERTEQEISFFCLFPSFLDWQLTSIPQGLHEFNLFWGGKSHSLARMALLFICMISDFK